MGNTVKAVFTKGSRKVKTEPLWQYDYGQTLLIEGIELPENYEVHFGNEPYGTATQALGGDEGVEIPDTYLTNAGAVYAWIYLHETENDGRTEYFIEIPVRARAAISEAEPTPVQQGVIEQTIAALESAVEEVEGIAEGIPDTIEDALQEAKDSGDFDGFSPSVEVTEITGGHQVAVTDASGTQTFDVMDGAGSDLIDDTAGSGDTDKVWSADKVTTELAGKADTGDIPVVTGFASKVTSPTENNFAALTSSGDLKDSGHKHSDYLTSHQDISGKADKVASAVNGNFAGLDSNGNLTDSGHKHSDYLTSHQDISGKLDKPSTAGTSGQVLTSDGNGGQAWQTPTAPTSIIDDTAGDGDTNKVWSADKSSDELSDVMSALSGKLSAPETAGTSGQVLVSDGEGGQVWGTTGQGTITVDSTLSVSGAAADAKATGTIKTNLENTELISILDAVIMNGFYINTSNNTWATSDIVRYCILPVTSGDKLEITAPSSKTSPYALLKQYTTPTAGASPSYSDATGYTTAKSVSAGATVKITVPSDTHYIYLYAGNSAVLNRLPVVMKVNGYDYLKTARKNINDLYTLMESGKISTLKIMQYNIGKFTWGDSSQYLETEASGSRLSFDDYVLNYKKALCKYHPDIISLEEFKPEISVKVSGSSPVSYNTEDMDELIFDPVYPFNLEFDYSSSASLHRSRSLKSKIGASTSFNKTKWYTISTVESGTEYIPAVIGYYNVDGKNVCCISIAFPWTHTDEMISVRSSLLSTILTEFQNEEYCFIGLDLNNGGNDSTVTSKDEAESLLTLAKTKGFNFANGGYLPVTKTYVPNTPSEHYNNLMLDNIIYRDNGKTILRDFKVLMDEYDNLTSDHVPIIGEFILI